MNMPGWKVRVGGMLAALALFAAPAAAQTAPRPTHTPLVPVRIVLSPASFAGLPRISETVKEENGATVVYSGVNLDAVLIAAGAPRASGISGPALASYVLVRAADGYQAVFALPELDAAFTDRVILLADRREGAPLPAEIGPYRIVVPGEGRHARWVHSVLEVDLVPLP